MKHCFNVRIAELIAVLLVLFMVAGSASAQSGNLSASGSFNLQGRLLNSDGTAVTNGSHMLTVNVYSQGTTQAIFQQTDSVTTFDGIFSTMVGSNGSSSLMLNGKGNYSLGISVDGQAELLPHIDLGKAPQAISASTADSANVAISANTAINATNAVNATLAANANAV